MGYYFLSKKIFISTLAGAAIGLAASEYQLAAKDNTTWPGPRPDGSMLLPNMWSLQPAGSQVELGDFPVNIALRRDGRYAAILHCGYSAHEIIVVDLETKSVVSHAKVAEAFYGIAFSPDGKKIYCSGSSGEEVFAFDFADGKLSATHAIRLRDPK